MLSCIIHEDEDVLVVNKPAGINTHSPDPYAAEGLYEFLKHRELRWAGLAIIHRLDKETSGVIVFSKTRRANQSLTEQFTTREIRKRYCFLTPKAPGRDFIATSSIERRGEKYISRPARTGSSLAETRFFKRAGEKPQLVWAEPRTGRTHQIRVHAAEHGFPILGDRLYGGAPAPRLCLHSERISFRHPASGAMVEYHAPFDFSADPRLILRAALIEANTNAFRLTHGLSDSDSSIYIDKLGPFLLAQTDSPLSPALTASLAHQTQQLACAGAYHKLLSRRVRGRATAELSPSLVYGNPSPEMFEIQENGLQFRLSFSEGYSVGIFLDQRENRRRLLTGHVAAGFPLYQAPSKQVLNTFAYTCAFSVAAALGGAHVTSLDLSRKYLDWGKRNFLQNQIDPARHDFIFGDVFDWMKRLTKRGRKFDVVLLDPPTFSQSRESGVFRAERDYPRLITAAAPLLDRGGVILASTNAADWAPKDFIASVVNAASKAGRAISKSHYVPQPVDFPISKAEPAYLKTVWLSLD